MLAHYRQCVTEHKEITDVFDDFSRPADPVAAWHNREFVAYRPFAIVDALQIPTLRSLEVRTFCDKFGRGDFDPSKLPAGFRSSITELYLNGVENTSTAQLEALIPCLKELKVLKVENCTFDTGNKLMELVARFHSKTMEVIHYGKKQSLCGAGGYSAPRLYDIQHLSRFTNLRHLVVEIPDILYGGFKNKSTLHDALCLVFPPSLKDLKILLTSTQGHRYWASEERPVPGKLEVLDNAIAGFLRAKSCLWVVFVWKG